MMRPRQRQAELTDDQIETIVYSETCAIYVRIDCPPRRFEFNAETFTLTRSYREVAIKDVFGQPYPKMLGMGHWSKFRLEGEVAPGTEQWLTMSARP